MIVKVPSNKCAIRDGVYKYISKQDNLKTVPVIRFDYKNAPKSKKDISERLEDMHNEVYSTCLYEFKLDEKEEQKICSCFTERFMKYVININSQENMEYSEDIFNKIIEECNNLH